MHTLITQNNIFNDLLCTTCLLGALGQEILHWYNLKLELKNDVKFYTSSTYWIITLISILFFGLTTKLLAKLVFDDETISNQVLFIIAFSYPMVLKQISKLITKKIDNSNPKSEYSTSNNYSKTFKINDYLKNF